MVFENPHALLLLPLASLPLVFGASRNQARVAGSGMLGEAGVRRGALLRVLRWLQAIAVILLVVAAAEPAAGLREVRDQWPRRGMVLAVDTSESMAAMDMRDRAGAPTTRLRAVRQACMRFVAGRPGDRIGLVIFGGRAATQCPPTVDGAAVLRALGRLECGALGRRTALGDGIALAAARIGPEGGTIILLSDGSCTA
jgi:Ca-activated chloride channel family protein